MSAEDRESHSDPPWASERLELRAYLGGGATSRVYDGYAHDLGREVAVKVVRADVDARTRERIGREVTALARARHPAVVAVLGHGELPDGRPYLVMERIHGQALHELLEEAPGKRWPSERALPLAVTVLDALAALHAVGVVHRDVKPANVIVSPTRGPVLVDLGFARLAEGGPKLTPDGRVVGTPGFIPPEVLFGVEAAPSADVYALGVLLYRTLAGRAPFTGELSKMIVAIMRGPRPDVREHAPEVSPLVSELVARAMSRDVSERPSAADLAAALRALLPDAGGKTTGA